MLTPGGRAVPFQRAASPPHWAAPLGDVPPAWAFTHSVSPTPAAVWSPGSPQAC